MKIKSIIKSEFFENILHLIEGIIAGVIFSKILEWFLNV